MTLVFSTAGDLHVFSAGFVESNQFTTKRSPHTINEAPKAYFSRPRLMTVKTKRAWTWPRVLLHAYDVLSMLDYTEEGIYLMMGLMFKKLGVKYLWQYQGNVFGEKRNIFYRLLLVREGE